MNFAAISTFISTKLMPAVTAITTALPGLLSPVEADVQASIASVTKTIADLQTAFATLVADVKTAS